MSASKGRFCWWNLMFYPQKEDPGRHRSSEFPLCRPTSLQGCEKLMSHSTWLTWTNTSDLLGIWCMRSFLHIDQLALFVWCEAVKFFSLYGNILKAKSTRGCAFNCTNKSPLIHTVDGRNPANHLGFINLVSNGINYQPQVVSRMFFHPQYFNDVGWATVFDGFCLRIWVDAFPPVNLTWGYSYGSKSSWAIAISVTWEGWHPEWGQEMALLEFC